MHNNTLGTDLLRKKDIEKADLRVLMFRITENNENEFIENKSFISNSLYSNSNL